MARVCTGCGGDYTPAASGQDYCTPACRSTFASELNYAGYVMKYSPDHPRANHKGMVFEHILVAEKALGRFLPPKALVHHVDGNPANNAPANLVICEDQALHMIIHYRQRMVVIGADPDTEKKCSTCQEVKAKGDFTRNASCWDGLHPDCRLCKQAREIDRKRRRRAEREAAMVA